MITALKTSPRFRRLNVIWELPETWCETEHISRALEELERQFAAHGLAERFIFVVTSRADQLPLKHRDRVIVVQTSDEAHEVPDYVDDVFMIFKNYRPFAPAPGNLRIIPLGCNKDVPAVEPRPMAERSVDLFFIGRPEYRDDFFAAARLLSSRRDLMARISAGPSFREGMAPEIYGATLADTKIALSPRGVSHETFRTYEALRAGCAVIAARHLPAWFTDGWPVIEVDDWRALPELADTLLGDPARLESLSRLGLEWWRAMCSPEAVGRYMAREIVGRLKAI